jgi:hypothetical protein
MPKHPGVFFGGAMYEDNLEAMKRMTKMGANNSDIVEFKRRYEKGQTAEQISQEMNIDLRCVKSFDPNSAKAAQDATLPPAAKLKTNARRR